MSGRSPGGKGPPGSRCILLVQRCLAIQLHKVGFVNDHKKGKPSEQIGTPARNHVNTEFWMYDSGYLLFQGFLEANMKCFWNLSLLEAMRVLEFQGYVSPGVLLVTASACALEVIRAAWARNVLRPPNNYVIAVVGDIEDCLMQPLTQGQFTPLPEALCWVILDLTSSGQAAVTDKICSALQSTFTDMESPSHEVVYDALAKLTQERKVYQTSRGYFVVTPEKRRRDSHSNRHRRHSRSGNPASSLSMSATRGEESQHRSRLLLMSTDEAMALVHGEMQTIRDGDITHQAVQTNLADVICGGDPNDKIMYARITKRSSSFPISGHIERRHSLRLFGSSKRLSSSLTRCGSLKHISNKHSVPLTSNNASSTEDYNTECNHGKNVEKKTSLLSRLFRRSGRKRGLSAPPAPLVTFSAQFPPTEWFNPRVVHLHSIGTQTSAKSSNNLDSTMAGRNGPSQISIQPWTDEDTSLRAATLPRRHQRNASGDSAISLATGNRSHTVTTTSCSTPRSSRHHRSSSIHSSTLPRRSHSPHSKSGSISCSTSRTSVLPQTISTPLAISTNTSPCKSLTSNSSPQHQSISSKTPSQLSLSRPQSSSSRSTATNQNSCTVPSILNKSCSPNKTLIRSNQVYSSPSKTTTSITLHSSGSHNTISPMQITPLSASSVRNSNHKSKHMASSQSNTSSNKGSHSSEKNSGTSLNDQVSIKKTGTQVMSPNSENRSSITLQVSTSNRSSPPNSDYSSRCQSSNGQSSVVSPVSSSLPYQDSPKQSITVQSESPSDYGSTNTTTTTIDGGNTKIYVQQNNSPMRSVITFENDTRSNKNGYGISNKEIVILNDISQNSERTELPIVDNVPVVVGKGRENVTQANVNLECPNPLYNSLEVVKSSHNNDTLSCISDNKEVISSSMDTKQFLSSDCLSRGDCIGNADSVTRTKLTNSLNNTITYSGKSAELDNVNLSSTGNIINMNTPIPSHHTNAYISPTSQIFNDPTMNNTRNLSVVSASPTLPIKNKEGLDFKNIFQRGPTLSMDGSLPTKNKICSNPSSPTKSFGSFGGSYGNLFIEGKNTTDKLSHPHSQELFTGMISVEDNGLKSREGGLSHGLGSADLCPYTSLSDLTVHFKSLAAQKILKGVSINSIDTLVEVNMAAAEKQNNCDVTIHTDLGMV